MPILSMFYGVVVRMYFFDDKQHHLPHVPSTPAMKQCLRLQPETCWLATCPLARRGSCKPGSRYTVTNSWPTGNWR